MEVKVKFMARGLTRGDEPGQYRRMMPDSSPTWGNCRFTFDIDDNDYDWLVVYHDIPDEDKWLIEQPLHCPKDRTILITPEPSSITVYGSDYVQQFGMVITFQEPWALAHPNIRYRAPGIIWYYGFSFDHGTYAAYDELLAEQPEKTKLISTMCSSRTGKVTLHTRRLQFSNRLQKDLPELDVFGHGLHRIDDKAEALRPYKYHVVVENHVALHHLTEKLPDAFLGYTLPFFHGAPNAADYFPKDSFIPIDINDYGATLDIIKSHIANNEYEDRLPYIREARKRALEEMNLFAIVANEISASKTSLQVNSKTGVISNRRTMRIKNPLVAVRSLSEKAYIKSRHRLTSLFR
jgi:hypothetical protein